MPQAAEENAGPGGLTVDTSAISDNITPVADLASPRSPRSQKLLNGVHTIAQSHAMEFFKLCFEEVLTLISFLLGLFIKIPLVG